MKLNAYHLLRVVRFGWKNLYLHKLRSLLTVLGIVFGVASVIAMLAIGEGASFEAREKIKQLGSNNIIIRAIKLAGEPTSQQETRLGVYGLNPEDFRRIKTIPTVEKLVPCRETDQDIWYYEKNVSGRVVGTVPDYAAVMNLNIVNGRFFNEFELEGGKPLAVIGASVKKTLFLAENPVGKFVKVKSSYFRVIGVTGEKSVSGAGSQFAAEDINFDIYIPMSTERSIFGEYEIAKGSGNLFDRERNLVKFHRFVARVSEMDKIVDTSTIINGILNTTHKKADYEILVPLQLLQQAEHTTRIFNIVLGSIAAISLLVGGIGIMNIMLATVTERTREIGIRRALGARRRDIINQFLSESVILSALGGLMGVFLGVAVPSLVTRFAGMATIVSVWSIL
ncbi:MAG TPA: ABC transporter permease, partial [bacterium]|nr:ABC transporter permease [bacterium]